MRSKLSEFVSRYKIIAVDDEIGIIDTLSVFLKRFGYNITGITNPLKAIELVKAEHFDLMILDYLMIPLLGDEVVEKIREFNKELYILMLTGYKDLAPPLETLKKLDIQGYCEKNERLDQLLLLVESGIKSVAQRETIKRISDGLNKILESVPKIYQLQPIDSILEEILIEIMPLVESKNAFILVDNTAYFMDEGHKSIYRGIGKYKTRITDFMEMLGPEQMERIGKARMTRGVVWAKDGVILPLICEIGQSSGVIYVETNVSSEGIKLLEIFAAQVAASINNAFLHSLVNMKNDELNNTYELLKIRYLDTIEALRLVVDEKDVYTRGHSDRVAYYALQIGRVIGLTPEEMNCLKLAGIFHDVGKTGISDDIILKTEQLSEREYDEIKKHPIKGARILSAVSMFKDVVPIVKYHHERPDGRGYPDGLCLSKIPFLSRIISVADAFDAMTSDRHYRMKLNAVKAREQLIKGSGTQFDEEIVRIFIGILGEQENMINECAAAYLP